MADRISDFTAAGTLIGTELVPIVQSGVTVRTTVAEIANASSLGLQGVTDISATTTLSMQITPDDSANRNFDIQPVGSAIPVLTLTGSSLTGGSIQLSDGGDAFRLTIGTQTLTSNNNITFPDADGRVALINGGLMLPNMTKVERDALVSPAIGSAIFQTDNIPGLRVYNGTNWMRYTETID